MLPKNMFLKLTPTSYCLKERIPSIKDNGLPLGTTIKDCQGIVYVSHFNVIRKFLI